MSAPARKPHQTYISNDLLTKHCCTHPLYTYEGCRFQDRYSKSWIWLDHTFWIMWGPSGKWFRFSFGIPWNLRSPWNVIIVHGDDIIHRKWGQHPNINSPFKTATFLDSKSWDKEGKTYYGGLQGANSSREFTISTGFMSLSCREDSITPSQLEGWTTRTQKSMINSPKFWTQTWKF